MTNEQINVAIAEVCGYKQNPLTGWWFGPVDNGGEPECPDYCTDLNAMHEAEKTLNGNHQRIAFYQDHLIRVLKITGFGPFGTIENWLFHATAHQRAEAFLRTLNKWKD